MLPPLASSSSSPTRKVGIAVDTFRSHVIKWVINNLLRPGDEVTLLHLQEQVIANTLDVQIHSFREAQVEIKVVDIMEESPAADVLIVSFQNKELMRWKSYCSLHKLYLVMVRPDDVSDEEDEDKRGVEHLPPVTQRKKMLSPMQSHSSSDVSDEDEKYIKKIGVEEEKVVTYPIETPDELERRKFVAEKHAEALKKRKMLYSNLNQKKIALTSSSSSSGSESEFEDVPYIPGEPEDPMPPEEEAIFDEVLAEILQSIADDKRIRKYKQRREKRKKGC